ncbi:MULTISPECIES: hypothetical protein [unclassified Streptomyces]|uniref:hypothetical protein n=1 Tax=unclassified Streptomyces TaxID=2593676 RepID=UPI00148998BB|nr:MULTISPECIES: hypothetical protein [unclassified Streptomyces]
MPERLTFTLAGRDELSRVMNGTADSADRLRLRLAGITADADGNLRDLQGRFLSLAEAQRLVDDRAGAVRRSMTSMSDAAGAFGESLKANLISLLPAAIPAVAGLAGSAAVLAGQLGAVGVAAGAYALALGPQISAISEAVEAQQKYEDAVAESGAQSEEAIKAQLEYQRQLAKMPPATREAAVAVGLLKDNYQEWSDALSDDVMAPFIKGVAVTNELLPKTTGLVEGASGQFDRLITLVGGAIATPGFDAMAKRFEHFATDTLTNGVDRLTIFLAKLQSGQYDGGQLQQWWDYSREVGPVVADTLENVADALLNVLEAGADVGVGMLDVVNVLTGIVSAVPPEAIAVILQLAIAIKAVKLAAAGMAAASTALAAFGVQIAAMRTAAAAAPGPLAATGAAIGALSRTAKLAMAGTGIGLLLITLGSLSSAAEEPQPDIDKLSTSLIELGRSGKVSGEALRVYGADLSALSAALDTIYKPSNMEAFLQGWAELLGMDSTGVEQAKERIDGVDQALASLVSEGRLPEAAAAADMFVKKLGLQGEEAAQFRSELDGYNDALAGHALEQKLAAEAMGAFGDQALEVQAKLDAQKQSADGLRQSIIALNEVNRAALDAQAAFEESIDKAAEAASEYGNVWAANGGKLDLTTEKGRGAYRALSDLAAKTNEATTAARESGASWSEANGIYEQGRQKLIASAVQMGLTRGEAKSLADQILKTPDKTAKLRANMEDLQKKLDSAKSQLKRVPDSRKAKVRANIDQLTRQLEAARRQLNGLDGKTATTYVVTRYIVQGATGEARNRDRLRPGSYAQGGLIRGYADGGLIPGFPDGGLLRGPGTPTSDSILLWGSTGEYMVREAAVDHYGQEFFDALNAKEIPIGRAAPQPGMPAASAPSSGEQRPSVVNNYTFNARKSVVDFDDFRLWQRQEEARQRVGRPR